MSGNAPAELIVRLRTPSAVRADAWALCAEAADQLTVLTAALEKIRDHDGVSYRFGDEVRAIARAALTGEQG